MLRRQARTLWILCRDSEAAAATQASLSILEPLGPTVELAWAYATCAVRQMLRGEYGAATASALRAQAIAEQYDDPGVLSDALNTLAVSAHRTGRSGEAQMRRALDVALAARRPEQAARAYANFCVLYKEQHDFAETERYVAAGLAYCDEHDLTAYATFLRSERANVWEHTGRWEESAAVTHEILDNAESSPADRFCGLIRLGRIRARRGRPGVWQCLDEAAAIALESDQRPTLVTVRLERAEAYWLEGRLAQAAGEADSADDVSAECDPWTRGAINVWLVRTGAAVVPRGQVAEPYRLQLGHDPVRAAQAWTDLDCRFEAAMALSDAPEEAHLREALRILTALGAAPAARIVSQRLESQRPQSEPAGAVAGP